MSDRRDRRPLTRAEFRAWFKDFQDEEGRNVYNRILATVQRGFRDEEHASVNPPREHPLRDPVDKEGSTPDE